MDPQFWERLLQGLVGTLVFGTAGILLMALGFKVFDWMTPRVDIQKQLAERQNLAVAVVIAAIILGVSYVIATAVQ